VTAATPDRATVAARLERLRERIASAGGGEVAVLAVTKGFGPEAVAVALALGLTALGENYADELVEKAAWAAGASPAGGPPTWHYLGAVQRNKVPRLAPVVACWQGVTRVAEGRAIGARHPGARVLVQVDVAGLPGRGGVPPAEVPGLVAALRDEPVDVAGLMCVGPPGPPEGARTGFRTVARLADRLGLPERSMGMSADLEVAVAEGSTMVRVGTALFGERPPR
jgi:uncharacterized pyridoxal phosphate-containing UPF0001 family protein